MEVIIKFMALDTERHKINCLYELIKNCYNQKATLEINSQTDESITPIPYEEIYSDNHKGCRQCLVKFGTEYKRLTISECIQYCHLILKQVPNINDCCNQYKVLNKYGVSGSALKTILEINDAEMSSIESGSPYPYLQNQWTMIFKDWSHDSVEEEERKLIQEAKQAFEVDEEELQKFNQIHNATYLRKNRIKNDGWKKVDWGNVVTVEQLQQMFLDQEIKRMDIAEACNIDPRSFRHFMDTPRYKKFNEYVDIVNKTLGCKISKKDDNGEYIDKAANDSANWSKITTFQQFAEFTLKKRIDLKQIAEKCGINYNVLIYLRNYGKYDSKIDSIIIAKLNDKLGCNIKQETELKTKYAWITSIQQLNDICGRRKEMTIQQVAEKICVSQSLLYNILSGRVNPTNPTIDKINASLGCRIPYQSKRKPCTVLKYSKTALTSQQKAEAIKYLQQCHPSDWKDLCRLLHELKITQDQFVELSGVDNIPGRFSSSDIERLNSFFGWNFGYTDTRSSHVIANRHKLHK